MKSTIILSLFFLLFSVSSYSQVKLTASYGYQRPTDGEWKSTYDIGYGFLGGVEYSPQGSKIAVSADVSYNTFTRFINLFSVTKDLNILLVTGGIKYFIKSEDSRFYPYLGAKLGMMRQTNTKSDTTVTVSGDQSETSFVWAPQVGVRFDFTQSGTGIDLNFQYTSSSTKNGGTIAWIGLNAGLVFAL